MYSTSRIYARGSFRHALSRYLLVACATVCMSLPARAANKEMVQLQTQVQQLQDAVARLQQSSDERAGVMKDLVQQTADAVNRMSLIVGQMQQKLTAQGEGQVTKVEQVSGQVQSLNDSIDELKARLQRIEKSIGDVQSTQQSLSVRLDGGSGAGIGSASPLSTPTDSATPRSSGARPARNAPPAGFPDDTVADTPGATNAGAANTSTAGAPSAADLYQTAYSDYNGAKYQLAKSEFGDLIRFYPESNYAGNAYFYLGEMLFKARDYGPATRQYDKVIEQYPGNPKVPPAQLRKGQALIAIKQTDAGVRELRSLIQRFPNSPEAVTARGRLNELGVGSTSRR